MDAAVSAFPLVQDLNRIVVLLLIVNALLTGMVILFAWLAASYKEQLDAQTTAPEEENTNEFSYNGASDSDESQSQDPMGSGTSDRVVWRPPA